MPKGAVSPRRLSRARPPPPTAPSHSNSVSSNSSARAERSTRAAAKASSPQKSSTPQSLTSEASSEQPRAATSEPPQLRRSRRQLDNDEDGTPQTEVFAEDDIIEDEETTRCVCGLLDYPGPPDDLSAGRTAKSSSRPPNADDPPEERGGLFIQCDTCQVWQHGGCVSIMEDALVPDNYYCEECKPELHELLQSGTGQNFSHYLPVWHKTHPKSLRKSSVVKDEPTKLPPREKASRLSATLPDAFTKRRATMNSRAAYDEDEVLRKVLEESKIEGTGESLDNGSRKGKRFRDESEDVRSDIKRQRTGSSVISSHSGADLSGGESDGGKGIKKPPRGAAAKSQREKEMRDREKERADAANKRKERLGRRRADESEPLDENTPKASTATKTSPPTAEMPDIASTNLATTSKRAGKRPGAGRGRSYQASTADEKGHSPKDETSGSGENTSAPTTAIVNGTTTAGRGRGKRGAHATAQHSHESGESDKDGMHHQHNGNGFSDVDASVVVVTAADSPAVSSSTHTVVSKKKEPSMAELKRRAAAMLEWVERAKDDYAGRVAVVEKAKERARDRPELGSVADMLSTKLVGWQVEFGAS